MSAATDAAGRKEGLRVEVHRVPFSHPLATLARGGCKGRTSITSADNMAQQRRELTRQSTTPLRQRTSPASRRSPSPFKLDRPGDRSVQWASRLVDDLLLHVANDGVDPSDDTTASVAYRYLLRRCGVARLVRDTWNHLVDAVKRYRHLCPACSFFHLAVSNEFDFNVFCTAARLRGLVAANVPVMAFQKVTSIASTHIVARKYLPLEKLRATFKKWSSRGPGSILLDRPLKLLVAAWIDQGPSSLFHHPAMQQAALLGTSIVDVAFDLDVEHVDLYALITICAVALVYLERGHQAQSVNEIDLDVNVPCGSEARTLTRAHVASSSPELDDDDAFVARMQALLVQGDESESFPEGLDRDRSDERERPIDQASPGPSADAPENTRTHSEQASQPGVARRRTSSSSIEAINQAQGRVAQLLASADRAADLQSHSLAERLRESLLRGTGRPTSELTTPLERLAATP